MSRSIAVRAPVRERSMLAPAQGALGWRRAMLAAGCFLFVIAGVTAPSVADESVIAIINKKPSQAVTGSVTKEQPAKRAVQSAAARAHAKMVLPDPSLLTSEPAFDCAFKGPMSSPITAEETRMKLDYEAQCYRQSDAIVRARLEALQQAVNKMIKGSAQRE